MKFVIQYILKILSKAILKKYDPDVIGITGSVGKTSTKEAVKAVLEKHSNVRASIKNYNNEIGVPLTIIGESSPAKSSVGWLKVFLKALKLILIEDKSYPQKLILEMGADKVGDIGYLVKLAPCDIGVVTSVSEVHFEFFKSLKKIEKEKRKIIEHLKDNNFALLNRDSEIVWRMRDKTKAKVLSFGFDGSAQVRCSDATISYKNGKPNGMSFKVIFEGRVVPVFVPKILGYGQIYSVLSAIAIGTIYEINLLDIVESLNKFSPPKGRMNLIKGIKQSLIIDDTYNSSPDSVKSALEIMQEIELPEHAKKIVVLGDMLELGSYTEEGHKQVGLSVAQNGIDILITKGEASREIAASAISAGMSKDKVFNFSDNEKAGRFLQERISKGDLILIKGSQGMRLEQIVKEVMARPLQAEKLLVRQGKAWR
ncbi:UDP-N-acetylmuramoyl-tripeptide--D-alanyl-D-alanine ligase [Candidatus Falkowbacteria bacterium]|jgi:UDP-N-acetylmuramoyl-tripeptide--D-alanyl-D-alanine ligase|nr:UDP-N-acetylmuramoyl-tripeptide--D-alanyl-D-alanine ligase [Candidatus Falkowbacteria bacterium]MBT4433546.1 UDP-N-acetylmuramoyl-tripeptide--D-alanyl-D-alanine ligase [Candidatus Falkowbacteria bacterium]